MISRNCGSDPDERNYLAGREHREVHTTKYPFRQISRKKQNIGEAS
jgi:hypothetical protein